MKVVYALEKIPSGFTKSLFLAGPTPRTDDTISWRKEALDLLEKSGYDGVVFIPEAENGKWHREYDNQIEWEEQCLNIADCILFWIPRELGKLPGFTTNDEFGVWKNSGKVVLGIPDDAEKVSYQHYYSDKLKIPKANTLEDTIKLAINKIGTGALRCGAECQVPLYIWKTLTFQQWYKTHVNAGNRLDGAKILWTFRTGPNKDFVFLWVLHANIYIGAENRNKVNEFVIARTDLSSVVVYKKEDKLEDCKIVLVREFRSPVSNSTGFVWECPGGSSPKPSEDPLVTASDEVYEETGLKINSSRFKYHEHRQAAATLSSHHIHMFSVEITDEELQYFESQKDIAHGNLKDSERTFIEIIPFKDLLKSNKIDWSTIGMVLSVLKD